MYKVKKLSEEHKYKLSEAHKGKKLSKETKRKISEALKGKGGKKHTEETKIKMSKAHKNKKHTEEHKRKNSKVHKGKIVSEETKRKMSESKKGNKYSLGKKLSGETKYKMSEAKRGMYCGKPTTGKRTEYCYKYNPECKESCHDKWYHTCVLCGRMWINGKKHHTHHIDYNKQSGCDESQLRIIELCGSCHGKTNGSEGNKKKYQNILYHIYILREWIDEIGYNKFDYRSISDLGSLDYQEGE